MPIKRPSIEDVGLTVWLNNTRDIHNGFGYVDFVKMTTSPDEYGERIPKSRIARRFNVDRQTIYNWIDIYNKERNI